MFIEAKCALYVGTSPLGGRGVFCHDPISAQQLIEVCPALVLKPDDRPLIHRTQLHDYYFIWGAEDQTSALILGYGSLYNHAYAPNAEYRPDYEADLLVFWALQDIPAHTEITVNYHGTPSVQKALWFDVE